MVKTSGAGEGKAGWGKRMDGKEGSGSSADGGNKGDVSTQIKFLKRIVFRLAIRVSV